MDPAGGNGRAESLAGDQIFQILRDGEPRTRAGLSAITGLARSTVASRVDTLLELGLIKPIGPGASTGGRPSSQFAFNSGARIALAVDLGASHCRLAVTDLASGLLSSRRVELSIADGPDAVLGLVARLGHELLDEAGRPASDLVGVGVGLPGPVEHRTGRPSTPPIMPGWDGFDVPGRLGESFDVPILVDNDVNIMALGERATAWPEVDDLVFVKVATGVGAGVIAAGRLLRGSQGIAGDLGHMLVTGSGAAAQAGRTLEDVASGAGIARQLRATGLDVPDARAVAALVRAGSPAAIAAVRQAGRVLGEALCNVICLVNPSAIVLGGGLGLASEDMLAGVREVVYSLSMPLATARLQIGRSATGEDAGVIGASLLAIESALGRVTVPE
ncbi:MAG: ROK family protein [Candidatus Nanopelagicales bacterium]